MKRRMISLLLAALMCLSLLPMAALAEEEGDKVLTIGTTASICAFGPGGQQTERYQCKMIFESLLEYDPVSNEYLPKLAESYEYVDDLTLKFKIREDVYFTNGDHLTADDVLYSLQEIWAVGSFGSYFEANNWEDSYVEDDYTLVLKYDRPYGPGLAMFCQWYIYSRNWAESATDEDWFSAPIGTSPYVLKEIQSGSHVSFARKAAEDYWGELPACAEVTYKYYAEASTMFIDFETGALDAAVNVSPSDAKRVLNGEYENIGYSLNDIKDDLNIVLSECTDIWDDVRVREAFSLSLDAAAVAEAAYGPLFKEATSTLPSSVMYYVEQEPYEYNYDRAKELLAEAGVESVDIRLVTDPGSQATAEALQACIAPGGFNLNIEVYDRTVGGPMLMNGEVDMMLKDSPGGAYLNDPCMLYDNFSEHSMFKAAALSDIEWVEAFNQALYSVDTEQRAEGYAKCQAFLHDNFRVIPVCERMNMVVWNTDVIADFNLAVADEPVVYNIIYA